MKLKALFKRPANGKALARRLTLGIVVVVFAVLLILWDAGILLIPGLTSPGRRPFQPKDEPAPTSDEPAMVDWAAWSEDQIRAMYDVSRLDSPLSVLTANTFDGKSHSVVRQFFSGEERLSVFGGMILAERDGETRYYYPGTADLDAMSEEARQLLAESDAYPALTVSSLMEIPIGEDLRLTRRLTPEGQAIFERSDGALFVFQRVTASLSDYYAPLTWDETDWETVPPNEGDNSGLLLICENGLYGYRGEITEGRKTVSVNVPCVYPVAFPYSEGYAVMADENGRLTIRDARGNAVLTEHTLLLPDGWREDPSFCGFHHGLLRAVSAKYSESGALLSRNDAILTTTGSVFSLPEGYRATAFREGVFVVTNGENYGYYASEGAWIGTPAYSYASPFKEGLATVEGEEGKQGLFSRQGKEILVPTFDGIDEFSGGLAVLRDGALGQILLWKVEGQYPPPGEETAAPNSRSYYERVPLSRGPKNTFDDGNDIIIVFPEMDHVPWENEKPVYTVPVETGRTDPPPTTSEQNGETTDPAVPDGTEPQGGEAPATQTPTPGSENPPENNGS